MSVVNVELRITSIRSRGKYGGAFLYGKTDDGHEYAVHCDKSVVRDASLPAKGQRWLVRGPVKAQTLVTESGYERNEMVIEAVDAELVGPTGENIKSWIENNSECAGIGPTLAGRLCDTYGADGLMDLIENYDIDKLAQVLKSEEAAQALCDAVAKCGIAKTLRWLDKKGIPRRIGKNLAGFYRDEAQQKLEANPYLLLSHCGDWAKVDHLAQMRFGVDADDLRRLEAAMEEILYRAMDRGHTCLPEEKVFDRLHSLLLNKERALRALEAIKSEPSDQVMYLRGYCQLKGAHLMEKYIATRLHQMAAGTDDAGQASLFATTGYDPMAVERLLARFEQQEGKTLTPAQRQAVQVSAASHMSLILGGAGTGKTTVLKALYAVLEGLQQGMATYQLALAGRASQRMAEATGKDAMTIAAFLARVDRSSIEMGSLLVVDEMSMVDSLLMYRLLFHVPGGVRLVLVGDHFQLTPPGPGLVLHALVGLKAIPQVELKDVRRQTAESGIPRVAQDIREHRVPTWMPYENKPGGGVSFVQCPTHQIKDKVLTIYDELGGVGKDYSVQILALTNKGNAGVAELNADLHKKYHYRPDI